MPKKHLTKTRNIEGFTLLEVVIAMAIMTITFAAILAVEQGSINASARAKQMNIVGMLARNQMIETEYKIEGKLFDEVKKEESGTFPAPYEDYKWKTTIKELKFPSLASVFKGGSGSGGEGQSQGTDMVVRLMTNFLSKALRQVDVTISWKTAGKDQKYSLFTYWVDLNYAFSISE